ncbi:MAG: nuclear transport factor 2 family protein [Bacteroidota bacterium]
MSQHTDLIHQFYEAFAAHDAAAMTACYHPEVEFTDPAFGSLKGKEAIAMWHMLISRAKGKLTISHAEVEDTSVGGTAKWEAHYVFGSNKRKVHNRIKANFTIQDGLIVKHEDEFDLKKWAKMALGPFGGFMANFSFFRQKIQSQSRTLLKRYIEKNT